MKIAIYGDSFAARWAYSPKETHWWYILGTMLNAEVECFGLSGTSTFFSYKNFLNNYKNFDLNIFFATNSFRYTKRIDFQNGMQEYIATYDQIDTILQRSKKFTRDESSFLESLRGWFIASDDEYNQKCQTLILKDVLAKDNKAIIYPSFVDSIDEEGKKELNIEVHSCAEHWLNIVNQYFPNEKRKNYIENLEVIACHFTPEINVAFAEAMYNYIKKGEPLKVPKELVKHNHEYQYYYKRI